MDRIEAAEEMGRRLSLLFAQVELTTVDEPGEMKEPLDDALRLMGYAEDELVDAAPADVSTLLITLRYFTLKRMLDTLAVSFDLSTDGDSYKLVQIREAVQKLLASAASDVLSIFGTLTITNQQIGVIQIDLNYKSQPDMREAFA